MSSRSRTAGSLVAVLTVLLLALGVLAPAEAATARSISVAASPTATYAGSSVKFSGRVTRSPKGSVVRIQRKAGTSWVTVVSTRTTTTTGSFAVRAALPKIAAVYSYRAVAPRTSRLATAASRAIAVTALRRTSVTLAPSPAGAINPGGAKLLVGKVSPFVPGTTGYVQRLAGTTWTTVTTVIVGTDGSISRSVTPSPSVTTSYRVVVARAGLNASGISPTVVVTVNQPPKITTTSLPTAGQNLAYSTTLAKSGKTGTWSLTGNLPTGINLNAGTGVISGTTATTGTFPITVKFTETSTTLSASKSLSLTVTSGPVITTASPLPGATRNAQYSQTLTKANGGNGTWSVTAGALPNGITLTSGGVLTGVPTAHTGSYAFTVTFKETGSTRTATKAFTLDVGGQDVAITTTSLPDATRLTSYSQALAKTGGSGTWSAETALPAGLGLNTSTGVITGTPTVHTGTYPITVGFTETSSGIKVTKSLSLEVVGQDVAITTTSLPDATRLSSYSQALAKTGGSGTWSAETALPAGLTLAAGTGVIGGTPTVATGTYPVSVGFTETASGVKVTKSLSLKVVGQDVAITTNSLDDATRAQSYSMTMTKTGGAGTWSATSLPANLVLNASTGQITGVPSVDTGSYSVTITFTETASGIQATRQYDLAVDGEDLAITTTSLGDATRGTAYVEFLTKTGGAGTWSATGLPSGITLNASTGALSGTPVARPKTYGVSVTFTETATSRAVVKSLNLKVTGEDIAVTTTSLPEGTTSTAYNVQLTKTGLDGTWSWTPAGTTSVAPTSTTSLPGGLSLNASTGVLSGTPSGSGDWNLVFTFTETASGLTSSVTLYLHVSPKNGPVISPASLPNGVVGSAYSANLDAAPSGGTWKIESTGGTLPPGVSLNTINGVISGTPTTAGDYVVIVKYTPFLGLGATNTKRYTIHVDPAG